MILTISCAKDYNALFNERIAELNKEGKYILNQYNDSVGKEHYIVYIDADKIVVDTLGDSLQVYPLGKVETYQYFPNVDFNDGKFSMERYNSTDCTIKQGVQFHVLVFDYVLATQHTVNQQIKHKI